MLVQKDIFYNQVGNINDKTTYSFNLQDVEGDNYLKNHNLKEFKINKR